MLFLNVIIKKEKSTKYSITKDEQQKSEDDYDSTEDKLKTQDNTYIVIAKGDVTGSRVANIMSLVQIRKNIVGLKEFTKVQQLASDLNDDGRTNIMDLVRERILIVGLE